MKTRTKYILSVLLVIIIAITFFISIITVMASLKTVVDSGIKISYVAKNVNAKVSAKYVVTENTDTISSWNTLMAGSDEFITFDSNDEEEEVVKSFEQFDLEITKNQYLCFKYTFEHTGTESNSLKFLNISITPKFTKFDKLLLYLL